MRRAAFLWIAAAVLAAALGAAAGPAGPRAAAAAEPAGPGRCYAVLLGAMPGEELYARHYRDWLARFHAHLTRTMGADAANVTVLSGDAGLKDAIVAGLATAESVKKALADVAAKARPQDQVILFLVGHGVITEQAPTLVLPGPDISAQDLADGLAAVPARNQVVVNLSSAAGTAIPLLARTGRVVVAATSPREGNEPVFPEFFLRALESNRADGEGAPAAGDKDGAVTVLEAYNWATRETALWIARLKKAGGGWKLDGKESVEIFEKLYGQPPGAPGTQKLAAGSDRSKPDAPVPIKPPGGKIDQTWVSRRVLSEHAMLEDCGEKDGVSAIQKDGYEPLAGTQPGQPGFLARRVVLGRADLLPAGGAPAGQP
jgi:hypothetical protein